MASLPPVSSMAATKARVSFVDTSETDTIQDAEKTIHIPTRQQRFHAPSEVESTSGGKSEETCGKLAGRPLDDTTPIEEETKQVRYVGLSNCTSK